MTSPARISSRHHPLVQTLRRVAAGRGEAGLVLLDGEHLVDEAVRAHVIVRALLTRSAESPVVVRAALAGAKVSVGTDAVLEAASPLRSPGEMVGLAEWIPSPLDAAIGNASGLIVGLIDVQDPGNVGGIIRSADALGASAVIAAGATADPSGWKALRGAMGSTFHLPVARGTLDALIDAAHANKTPLVATTLSEGEPLDAARFEGPLVILLGNEGAGLPPALVKQCTRRLHVPMKSGVNSLNVAVTAALILYEARRQARRGERR